ncbi:flagellar hook-length control protein FliK [Liquorilactobacillus satsumensis]|uniref:Flagellar hook-length control protein FliK n=1 Tax=Liquorilactobacillus satsumensis TaxID=259059 RepID=A0A0A7RM17_9LACO|nr:flagellar hook-length control protein FliK [Liquorilactobacillus satsumensis]AJA34313.1 flagellar hook-length control protein FliK [Liquorilactobacillus satsumensis]
MERITDASGDSTSSIRESVTTSTQKLAANKRSFAQSLKDKGTALKNEDTAEQVQASADSDSTAVTDGSKEEQENTGQLDERTAVDSKKTKAAPRKVTKQALLSADETPKQLHNTPVLSDPQPKQAGQKILATQQTDAASTVTKLENSQNAKEINPEQTIPALTENSLDDSNGEQTAVQAVAAVQTAPTSVMTPAPKTVVGKKLEVSKEQEGDKKQEKAAEDELSKKVLAVPKQVTLQEMKLPVSSEPEKETPPKSNPQKPVEQVAIAAATQISKQAEAIPPTAIQAEKDSSKVQNVPQAVLQQVQSEVSAPQNAPRTADKTESGKINPARVDFAQNLGQQQSLIESSITVVAAIAQPSQGNLEVQQVQGGQSTTVNMSAGPAELPAMGSKAVSLTTALKTAAQSGTQQVILQLQPENLGKVKIAFKVSPQQVQLEFKVETVHAKQMLAGLTPKFEQILKTQDLAGTGNTQAPLTTGTEPTDSTLMGQGSFTQNQQRKFMRQRSLASYHSTSQQVGEVAAQPDTKEQPKNIISILA